MADAFGFSTGDFITSIKLVKDIIKALSDSKGSSKEYQELIAELRNLETVLILVKEQFNQTRQIGQRTALRQAVEDCHTTIDGFLASIHKYHGHLHIAGSKNKWKSSLRKIQWHLCKADELTPFRLRIASFVQSIDMLLITIQTSTLSVTTQSVQVHEQEMICQTSMLSGMQDSLKLISQSFEALKATCASSGPSNAQSLAAIESTKQVLIHQHLQTHTALQRIQDMLPPQVLLQSPVMFLDALDRLTPIHLEWINSYEAFLAVLKVRFKHIGLRMVENGEFALQATKTKRDVDLNRPWDVCLYPGQAYDMSMLFEESCPNPDTLCTACRYPCSGKPDEQITCENCQTTFRRVFKVLEETVSSSEPKGPANSNPRKRRAQDYQSTDQVQDFRRVRLMCTVRSPSNNASESDLSRNESKSSLSRDGPDKRSSYKETFVNIDLNPCLFRLQGEMPLAQQSSQQTSKAYDKRLLSMIGKGNSPPRYSSQTSGEISPFQEPRAPPQVKDGSNLQGLSVSDVPAASFDPISRWVSSPASADVSPGSKPGWRDYMEYRSPSVDSSAPSSAVDSDYYARLRDCARGSIGGPCMGNDDASSLPNRSNRGRYDQQACLTEPETDFQLDETGGCRKLNLGDRTPPHNAYRQPFSKQQGLKRRALSPPPEVVRDDEAHTNYAMERRKFLLGTTNAECVGSSLFPAVHSAEVHSAEVHSAEVHSAFGSWRVSNY